MILDKNKHEWRFNHNLRYLISEYGEIINTQTGYQLKPTYSNGYLITNTDISKYRSGSVHRLVYENFIGAIPEGLTVNHIDGVKANNHYSNFEAITTGENTRHAHKMGLVPYKVGEDNSMAVLTEKEVIVIYSLFLQGYTNEQVGSIYKLHPRYISLLRSGRRWKYLFAQLNMLVTYSLGNLPFNLTRCRYIYNVCQTDGSPQRVLGERLGIDPSTVSRIRSDKTWKYFKHLDSPEYLSKLEEIVEVSLAP